MKVFKFGGASVKDADAVKNVIHILTLYPSTAKIIVISAMGKTTNALEEVVNHLWNRRMDNFNAKIDEIENYHMAIMHELFPNSTHKIFHEIASILFDLRSKYNHPLSENFDFEYDQIVSLGELISTKIVAASLAESGINSSWIDARTLIRTNNIYREAEVDWNKTTQCIEQRLLPLTKTSECIITQGFIGHTSEGFTTTLGREGSDFTAGILAYCINAESVTIWKDVPGMLNADPKWFNDTVKLNRISFKEAIELAYYGASVIHPKTIKPLQNKEIPLYVKSFIDPLATGTVIQQNGDNDALVPSYIVKFEQVLMSFTPKDFSFIVEENLQHIFKILSEAGVKINLMQNSALSFSILFDRSKKNPEDIVTHFKNDYEIKYNEGLELITIRHYDVNTIEKVTQHKEILVEQRTRQTVRLVVKNS